MTEPMIHIWTDGSWNHITKDMGIGIYAIYHGMTTQYSAYIGKGTNNIAELTAIKIALKKSLKYKQTPVRIFTDSQYCVGVLLLGWTAKVNIPLINSIKVLMFNFDDIKIKWVPGHGESKGNQIADEIAVAARKEGSK
jgi:ribonuclease HI